MPCCDSSSRAAPRGPTTRGEALEDGRVKAMIGEGFEGGAQASLEATETGVAGRQHVVGAAHALNGSRWAVGEHIHAKCRCWLSSSTLVAAEPVMQTRYDPT